MIAAGVFVGAPVFVPAGMDQYRFAFHLNAAEDLIGDLRLVCTTDYDGVEIRDRIQIERCEIFSTRIPVERTVEICASVRHHLDLADMKLRPGRVARSGFL